MTVRRFRDALRAYAAEVQKLGRGRSTTESTYYPSTKTLLTAALAVQNLPFEVRTGTSEGRSGGGTQLPDLAFYDSSGSVLALAGEVKLPGENIADMAVSEEHNDQIGRYLARFKAVLLCNVRGFGLVTVASGWKGGDRVPPKFRQLSDEVALWPSNDALRNGTAAGLDVADRLVSVIDAAVTGFATIAEPESLARVLAHQARRAKEDLPEQFSDAVGTLLEDFGKALGITFEGNEGQDFFRSSLIQTAFYALFAGWTLWHHRKVRTEFRWQDLPQYLRIPFLGELFYEFQHPHRIKELKLAKHLDTATQTLHRVDTQRFFARFGASVSAETAPGTNAIVYFYEPFLEAFDPALRKELGVWYTPHEIVRYQVARIDQLLRTELDCPNGFADERVVVLDPCCGTGAYLIEVARHIHNELKLQRAGASLGTKLLQALCGRIIGFEILTAPFVISQLQLYLFLSELGAEPSGDERLSVFLTNALTGWHGNEQLKLHFPELQQEHDQVQAVKMAARIIVVLGNPPYNRFAGVPVAEEAELADHYKGITRDPKGKQIGKTGLYEKWGIRKHLLDDLYVRFFRLAETRIGEAAEDGIVSFISNSSYLAGRSHPLMRESLLNNFQDIWIDNLHGNRLASERTPWGESCETVFSTAGGGPGIKVGTVISTFVKRRARIKIRGQTSVHLRDFWGRAEKKRSALLDSLTLDQWKLDRVKKAANLPEGPRKYEQFKPSAESKWRFVPSAPEGGYEVWPALDEIFLKGFQGVNPNRGLDGSVVDIDRQALEMRMREYFSKVPWAVFKTRYPELSMARAGYDAEDTRRELQRSSSFDITSIVPYVLFPLDARWLYYEETDSNLLNRRRPELWENLDGNLFLIAVPQPRRVSEARALSSSSLFDLHLHDRGSVGFPAVVRSTPTEVDLLTSVDDAKPRANLNGSLWTVIRDSWHLKGELHGKDAKAAARKLIYLTLAITHSPQYQDTHRDSLAQDWSRIPIPRDAKLADELADLGTLISTLLDPLVDASAACRSILGKALPFLAEPAGIDKKSLHGDDLLVTVSYYGAAKGVWRPRDAEADESYRLWEGVTGDLFLNKTVFLRHVPFPVWTYELGGYPVIKKWLGYRDAGRRPGVPLSTVELDYLRGMVQRIAALLALNQSLDKAYDQAVADALVLGV